MTALRSAAGSWNSGKLENSPSPPEFQFPRFPVSRWGVVAQLRPRTWGSDDTCHTGSHAPDPHTPHLSTGVVPCTTRPARASAAYRRSPARHLPYEGSAFGVHPAPLCVFRAKPATNSIARLPLIPRECCHRERTEPSIQGKGLAQSRTLWPGVRRSGGLHRPSVSGASLASQRYMHTLKRQRRLDTSPYQAWGARWEAERL